MILPRDSDSYFVSISVEGGFDNDRSKTKGNQHQTKLGMRMEIPRLIEEDETSKRSQELHLKWAFHSVRWDIKCLKPIQFWR